MRAACPDGIRVLLLEMFEQAKPIYGNDLGMAEPVARKFVNRTGAGLWESTDAIKWVNSCCAFVDAGDPVDSVVARILQGEDVSEEDLRDEGNEVALHTAHELVYFLGQCERDMH
jgi:hypothetical protein